MKNAKLTVEGKNVSKTFEVAVPEEGKYYVTAWVMGVNGQKDSPVYLDGQTHPIGQLKMSKVGWQFAQVLNNTSNPYPKRIFLSKGTHTFSFRCKSPDVPAVDFIRLTRQEAEAIPSDTNYRNYHNALKAASLPENYRQLKTEGQIMEKANGMSGVLSNPEGDYAYQLNIDFNYAYYKYFHFSAGQNVVFETKKDDPWDSDPVMYLFHRSDPVNKGSWSDDDGGDGLQSKIACTIQHTGYHTLLLRSFSSSTPGTSDLYKDGSLYASDVDLAGKKFYCGDISKTGELNYFTCKLTGDSRLWLGDKSSWPGLIKGWNDDYYGLGDFNWGLASRVKNEFSPDIRHAIVSSYSSWNPTGQCDVYMKLDNSTIMSCFPNLKADDAIKSAPASDNYNCISWSGGRTDLGRYFWPPDPDCPGNLWYDPDPKTAFDKFYGNNPERFSGAMTYTPDEATYDNAVVDLWAKSGSYTHASVRKPGDNFPHGYDWESKPGGLMRTLHPRHALRDSDYGDVFEHYKKAGAMKIAKTTDGEGKAIPNRVEKEYFSDAEIKKITALEEQIEDSTKSNFNKLYLKWKETWDDPKLQIMSNPREFAKSEEYEIFLEFCQKQGKKICPMLFRKFAEGDYLVTLAISDLPFLDQNREIFRSITSTHGQISDDGYFIINTPEGNWRKYIKELLAREFKLPHEINEDS